MSVLCGAVIIFALILIFLVLKIKKSRSVWKERGVKYDESATLFESLRDFITKSSAEMFLTNYNRCPGERFFGLYLFLQPMLLVKDADLLKSILVKDFDHFTNRRRLVTPDIDPLWARTLVALEDQRWHDMRTFLSPSFTGSKMRIIYSLVERAAKNFVQHYVTKGESFELELKDAITRFSNDAIATAAFGLQVDSYCYPDNQFYLMGKDATNLSGFRLARFMVASISAPLARLWGIRMIPKYLCNYFTNIIKETVKMREEHNIVRPDMIHLLREAMKTHNTELDGKEPITIEDLVAQAYIFFFAGFDTGSSALGFVFYELALNPEIQEQLTKEIDSIDTNALNYETLQGLKYLNMVVSESLRKWPPGLVIERVVNKPYTIEPAQPGEKAVDLKVGDIVMCPIIGVHRDPKYFPDPEKFDPERFSDENKHNIHPYANLSFGFGPRHCIGSRFALMEMKVFIFHFLKHFQVYPVTKTRIPMVLAKNTFNLTPEGGMHLGIKRRFQPE